MASNSTEAGSKNCSATTQINLARKRYLREFIVVLVVIAIATASYVVQGHHKTEMRKRIYERHQMSQFFDSIYHAVMEFNLANGVLSHQKYDKVVLDWFELNAVDKNFPSWWRQKTDVWGRAIRVDFVELEGSEAKVTIWSAGEDGVFDRNASDDLIIEIPLGVVKSPVIHKGDVYL